MASQRPGAMRPVALGCLSWLPLGLLLVAQDVAGRHLRRPLDDDADDAPELSAAAVEDVRTVRKNAKCTGGEIERWQIHVHHKCPANDPKEGKDGIPELYAKLQLGRKSGKRRAADEQLLQRVKEHMRPDADLQQALDLLRRVVGVEAQDVFALKETWTDDDTELLRKLDDADGGFTPAHLTTEAFAARLPTRAALMQLLEQKRLAMVGSGATLENSTKGGDIDAHAQVRARHGWGICRLRGSMASSVRSWSQPTPEARPRYTS
eukprot:TRINITY_DN828_c0_g1_i1.p1 TRINITY_DN828_c0_g1~~TRINITY_DN828_c0_g1_i1.p1  ORF type:complete len:281 (+),score=70.46 TRINITY_DN828_c0_g1_i1:54-845(+)